MNRLGSVSRPLLGLMAILLAAFVAGCGSGGGDDGGAAAPPPPAAPIGDVAGVWTITESAITSSSDECQPPNNNTSTYPVTIGQTGSALEVTDAVNPDTPTMFPGTIHGDQITWSGSFPELGGVTTWNSVNVTVGATCNDLSGTATWTYTQDAPAVFSCTGTTTFTGTADVADGCTVPESSS
jgi:hypothetical protein